MMKTGFCFASAAVMLGLGGLIRAGAYPLTLTLPPRAIPAPPPPDIPVLLGSWHDGRCLLLPPGVTPFEAVSDTITFRQDGTFTQVINKAMGRLKETGTYTVASNHLTLRYLIGSGKPGAYEFSRKGDFLLLQRAGSSQSETRTLSRVQNRDAS